MACKNNQIIFSGGGTLGSVTPLIAVYEQMKIRQIDFRAVWFGTRTGPEKKIIEEYGISYQVLISGKLRRYFSMENLFLPFQLSIGLLQSLFLLILSRPCLILTAGSFVSVPLVWAAWLLGIPVLVHQQDIRVGLANKLMAPFAKKITVAFENGLSQFSAKKTFWTGNPIRPSLREADKKAAFKALDWDSDRPVVLIFGGGTGAEALNRLVYESLPYLTGICNVLHITGKKRDLGFKIPADPQIQARYRRYEFLSQGMANAYAVADLVVARGGLSTLSELAALKKAAILIPMPDTHQEDNMKMIRNKKAALVLDQKKLNARDFTIQIKMLLTDLPARRQMAERLNQLLPADAENKIIELLIPYLKK